MVVEGKNDARLAVECDGDRYHGAEKWVDDMHRQRVLERAGWVFWRCFASSFIRRRKDILDDLLKSLAARGIEPVGAEGAPVSVHTEHRVVSSSLILAVNQDTVGEIQSELIVEPLLNTPLGRTGTNEPKNGVIGKGSEFRRLEENPDEIGAEIQLRSLGRSACPPISFQSGEPHGPESGPDISTIQQTFDWDSGAGRKVSDVPDAEIRAAIRAGIRSWPTEDELVDSVRLALGFRCDSESIRHRIIVVLNDELLARRVCKASDSRVF